jgi:hypothetical protein
MGIGQEAQIATVSLSPWLLVFSLFRLRTSVYLSTTHSPKRTPLAKSPFTAYAILHCTSIFVGTPQAPNHSAFDLNDSAN